MKSIHPMKIVLVLVFVLMAVGYIIGSVYETYWLGGGLMLAACGVLMLSTAIRRRQQRRENPSG